tara:strand:- start:2078 stop:3079 length:1002 start_codon:yes stop_codon:yes gene_type:complete
MFALTSSGQIQTVYMGCRGMGESSGKASDDIPFPEFVQMLGAVFVLVAVLLFGEVLFRWFIEPANTLLPIQLIEAWLWSNISNLIWPGSAELVAHQTGPITQVNLLHPTFYGGVVPLYVSDECTGLHELFFLGMMMLLTPSFDLKTKFKHLGIASLIVFILNLVRLVVLYPLAVSGCEGMNGGIFGCESPLFEFHDFVLRYGSLIVLVIGWTIWFNITDARKGVREFWNRLPQLQGISYHSSLDGLNSNPPRVASIYFSLVLVAISIIYYVSTIMKDTSSVEACVNTISATCNRITAEYEDAIGISLRLFLIGLTIFMFAWIQPRLNWLDEEE